MTADDEVVFLGLNSCGDFNIDNNSIIRIDSDLSVDSMQVLEGNYTHEHGAIHCYEEQEDRWDFPSCSLEIQDFELGPGGQGLVFRASAPNDIIGKEIWLFDDAGDKYPLTNDILFDANAFFPVIP